MSLAETGEIHPEHAHAGKVHVAWSDAYQDEEGFVVTGVARSS